MLFMVFSTESGDGGGVAGLLLDFGFVQQLREGDGFLHADNLDVGLITRLGPGHDNNKPSFDLCNPVPLVAQSLDRHRPYISFFDWRTPSPDCLEL